MFKVLNLDPSKMRITLAFDFPQLKEDLSDEEKPINLADFRLKSIDFLSILTQLKLSDKIEFTKVVIGFDKIHQMYLINNRKFIDFCRGYDPLFAAYVSKNFTKFY